MFWELAINRTGRRSTGTKCVAKTQGYQLISLVLAWKAWSLSKKVSTFKFYIILNVLFNLWNTSIKHKKNYKKNYNAVVMGTRHLGCYFSTRTHHNANCEAAASDKTNLAEVAWARIRWRVQVRTILGLAGAIVRLRQIPFHTGAGVAAIRVGTGLAAGPVHTALIKIWTTEATDGLIPPVKLMHK